eukprot:scaffold163804_cov84-Attheya_sp.AAC.1
MGNPALKSSAARAPHKYRRCAWQHITSKEPRAPDRHKSAGVDWHWTSIEEQWGVSVYYSAI